MDNQISEENAEQELQRILDYYDIDADDFVDEARQSFEGISKRLVKAFMKGRLEFDFKKGIIKQKLIRPPGDVDTITYQEVSGRAKISMGKHKTNDVNNRMYELLGALSGLGRNAILNLKGSDLGLAECLGFVFITV